MSFYEELQKGLLEAIEMEKGEMVLQEREDMPAPTYYVYDGGERSIEK